jgi:hypothetical protein
MNLMALSIIAFLSCGYPTGVMAGTTSSSRLLIFEADALRLKVPPNQQVPNPK